MAKQEMITREKRMEMIDAVVEQSNMAVLEQMPSFTRGLALGKAMKQLRELVDDNVMADVLQLAGSPLGFRTDKDEKGGYPKEVVKDAVIHCLLRGGSVVGNEMNIIAGKAYLTKEYYVRKCRELVHDLRVIEHVPQMSSGGALVGMEATWVFEGRADSIRCVKTAEGDSRIAVRVNSGMGVDAILGKAYRKLYARIYRRVTGSSWLEAEAANDPDEQATAITHTETVEVHEATEEAQEPPQQASVLEGIRDVLAAFEQVTQVDEWQQQAEALATVDEEAMRIAEWCDWRREQIRETRGERSNQKQEA